MARRRFFVSEIRNQHAELNGQEAHHLTRVLRVEDGQIYEISDNRRVFLAKVTEARRDRVVFSLIEPVPLKPPAVRLTLLASLFKFDRFEWMLEKGAELGVDTFIPVRSERSEKGLDKAAKARIGRWRRILLEASQQSRRDRLPVIEDVVELAGALSRPATIRLWLEEAGDAAPLLRALPAPMPPGCEVAILAGPEGGWTSREREAALRAGWTPVSLGAQVLRSETAALAAAAVVMSSWLASAG